MKGPEPHGLAGSAMCGEGSCRRVVLILSKQRARTEAIICGAGALPVSQ